MTHEKAHEFLLVAQRCLQEGWYNSAVNRAYYAMFQAACTALAAVAMDRPQWSHGGLHATFATELVRRRKWYPLACVHALTEAMELRHMADYSDLQISRRQATRTVHAAEDFLARVMERRDNA
jgi:uncharacterized protein (UPF0332 family)